MLCETLYFVYEGDPVRMIDNLSTVQIIGWRFDGKIVMKGWEGQSYLTLTFPIFTKGKWESIRMFEYNLKIIRSSAMAQNFSPSERRQGKNNPLKR